MSTFWFCCCSKLCNNGASDTVRSLFGNLLICGDELLDKKKEMGGGSNLSAAIKLYCGEPGFVLNRVKLAMQIFLLTNYPRYK